MNTFLDPCPTCGGDGEWESAPQPPDGRTHTIKCHTCEGTGLIEREDEPRTLDDIEDEDAP